MPVEQTKSRAPQPRRLSARRFFWSLALLCCLVVAAAFVLHYRSPQTNNLSTVITAAAQNKTAPKIQFSPHAKKNSASLPVTAAAPDPNTGQWVADLYQLPLNGALTPERISGWKKSFQQLLAEGSAAVPAIRSFLKKNVDVDFGPDGSHALGYSSARDAFFDLLKQIGGADAEALLLDTLKTTADPREISTLANALEQLSPGAYQSDILDAVRDTLAVAANGKLAGSDVAPLFSVLQKYGDSTSVSVLEQAVSQWKYYATMSLAQLPNGAGIPSLIQMAQNPDSANNRDIALQVLAQVASQYPEAADALLTVVKRNQIPDSLWPYLAQALTDGQYQLATSANSASHSTSFHITTGDQNFSTAPYSSDQVRQQLVLINELLSVASNPVAIAALQHSRDILSAQSSQFAAQ